MEYFKRHIQENLVFVCCDGHTQHFVVNVWKNPSNILLLRYLHYSAEYSEYVKIKFTSSIACKLSDLRELHCAR